METEAITLREGRDVPRDALLALYGSVGWLAYTRDPDALARAVGDATWVCAAWRGPDLRALRGRAASSWPSGSSITRVSMTAPAGETVNRGVSPPLRPGARALHASAQHDALGQGRSPLREGDLCLTR